MLPPQPSDELRRVLPVGFPPSTGISGNSNRGPGQSPRNDALGLPRLLDVV